MHHAFLFISLPPLHDYDVKMPTKQHGVRGGKNFSKTPGNAISETLYFKMSRDALAIKNLCLWCEFQSCLLFIISLLLQNVLTALALLRLHA